MNRWDDEDPWISYPALFEEAVQRAKVEGKQRGNIVLPPNRTDAIKQLKQKYDSAELEIQQWTSQLTPAQLTFDALTASAADLTREKEAARAQNTPDTKTPKAAKPSETITLRDGTKIEAVQVLKSEGTWVVKDKDGQVHTIDAGQIVPKKEGP